MLVLLIIFMVTAPMMQQGIDVDLPETTTQPMHLKDDSLVLTVKKDGTMLPRQAVVAPAELTEKLQAVLEARGESRTSSCAPTRRRPTASSSR